MKESGESHIWQKGFMEIRQAAGSRTVNDSTTWAIFCSIMCQLFKSVSC